MEEVKLLAMFGAAVAAAERAKYAPQLEAYVAVLQQTKGEPQIRLALYYPMLSKLLWWQP